MCLHMISLLSILHLVCLHMIFLLSILHCFIIFKKRLAELTEHTFNRKGSLYLACNKKTLFYLVLHNQKYTIFVMSELHDLLDNIFLISWWRCFSRSFLWCIYCAAYSFCKSMFPCDFNNRNQYLTSKLLIQGYRYHKLRQAFYQF